MTLKIEQVTEKRAYISDEASGGFMCADEGERVRVLFYALPKEAEVTATGFRTLIEDVTGELEKQGYRYLVSADIENPEVIKKIALLPGVRIFQGFEEVALEEVLNLKVSGASFDCSKDYAGEKVGPYRVSVPLSGSARPPFVWYEYDPKTGRVLKTYEEDPGLKGFFGKTDLFEVGDELINDHYVDLETGVIQKSFKKQELARSR